MNGEDAAAPPPPEAPPPASADPPNTDPAAPRSNDPASNPLGSNARSASETYWRGRRSLRVDGPAAIIDDAVIGEMQVGDRFNVFVGRGLALTSGSVRTEMLDWVRNRYVEVPGYDRMLAELRDRQIIVLRGQPGTGRATTALHLLDVVAQGKVFRLDVGDELKSFGDKDFEPERGYVAELSRSATRSMNEQHLDTLRDLLKKKSCFCVLIADGDVHRHGGYVLLCPPPDQTALLERHTVCELMRDGGEARKDRLLELAATPPLRDALGPRPRPVETARMATLLARHGRGELSLREVEKHAAGFVHQQVAEWFMDARGTRRQDDVEEAMRLTSFRIALAVFNTSPYNLVADTADKLAKGFSASIAPHRTPRTPLFADDQQNRLPAARAHMVDGFQAFNQARVPVRLVEFEDDRFPVIVLRHLWEHHHTMRTTVVGWLKELSEDRRNAIWIRAAQAAGLLCALDFPYAFTQLIDPMVTAESAPHQLRFAAIALDQAAEDKKVQPIIDEWLLYWRRAGTREERWTAAATLGYEHGSRSIERTLDELRVLGTPSERQDALGTDDDISLVNVASHSVSQLFAFGEVQTVLDRLQQWIGSDRRSLRQLALWTVLHMTDLHGFDLELRVIAAGRRPPLPRHYERWPLLLALQERDQRLTERFAVLLRCTLRARDGDWVAKKFLGRWIRAGERDPDCLVALEHFLPTLVETKSDRCRLEHLINRMRKDWSDPLHDEVANRLERLLRPVLRWEKML